MMYRTSTTRWRNPVFWMAVTAGLLAGCAAPSGPPITEQRSVGEFHAIEQRGAGDLHVQVGPATSLSVTADAGTLHRLATTVEDGRLVIDSRSGWSWFRRTGRVDVHITMPALDAVVLNGAGNAAIEGATGAALELALQGAGNIQAAGRIASLDASINGAGNMDLVRLVATDANVSVNGAGNMATNVTGTLRATVNGVGSVTYAGNPQRVEPAINGVGSVKAAPAANTAAN